MCVEQTKPEPGTRTGLGPGAGRQSLGREAGVHTRRQSRSRAFADRARSKSRACADGAGRWLCAQAEARPGAGQARMQTEPGRGAGCAHRWGQEPGMLTDGTGSTRAM